MAMYIRHQSLEETDIMNGNESWSEHFAYIKKVPYCRSREITAAVAVATFFQWCGIFAMAAVAKANGAAGCESKAVSAVASG